MIQSGWPTSLNDRVRTFRPRSRWYSAPGILRAIWQHPNNRGGRVRALLRAAVWQARKRIGPERPIGFHSGMKLHGYRDSSVTSKVVYFGALFDVDSMNFVLSYLRPGDSFLDAGANVGVYTLLAAAAVGKDGVVDAVEAAPRCVERLKQNVLLNDCSQVRIHAIALSASHGEVTFVVDQDVSNRVVASSAGVPHRIARVPAAPLDDVLERDRQYAMAKMDIEGSETAALLGAERRLREHDPPVWLIEAVDSLLVRQGSSRAELCELMTGHGYTLTEYSASSGRLAPASENAHDILAIATEHLPAVQRRLAERHTLGR
jgi:FkbM family methyltransferase